MIDYRTIEGHFTFPSLYLDMINRFPSGSKFVEVGLLYGQSLAYLIDEMVKAGKKFEITAIDCFSGQSDGMLEKFVSNLFPVRDMFELLVGFSVEMSEEFEDGEVDFVFIDADHSYENIKADIIAWLPKVKKGGVIAGHDYPNFEGVKRAVEEIFADKLDKKYALTEGCWFVEV